MVIDFCPSPFSRAKKQESEEEIIKVFIFVLGNRSTVDAVVEESFFLLEDSSVVSHHKRRTSEPAFPFVRRKEADFVV